MSILLFPAPDPLDCHVLEDELAAAGFDDPSVSVYERDSEPVRYDIQVMVAGLTDHMPTLEARQACATQDDLNWLLYVTAAAAAAKDADVAAKIAKVVDAHHPKPADPSTPLQRMAAAAGLTAAELGETIRAAGLLPTGEAAAAAAAKSARAPKTG